MLGVDSGLDEEAKEFLLVNVIFSLWRTSSFSIFGSFGAHIIHSFIYSLFGGNISRRFYDCFYEPRRAYLARFCIFYYQTVVCMYRYCSSSTTVALDY
jgi:hypothetical protein